MAGEFEKRVQDGENIWTCNSCNQDIRSIAKPRAHVCLQERETATTTPPLNAAHSAPQYQFNAPPPGYMTPGTHRTAQGVQGQQGAQGVQVQTGADVDALYRFQQFQAEQNKQMMMFFQQQNQDMMNSQQERTQDMLKEQKEQNEFKMNQMMEMMKIQKQKETKIKCPKWEKGENIKNFLNRLKRWDDIEKGNGKYLLLLESLQNSGRKREKLRVELEVQNNQLDTENENLITNLIE